MMININGGNMTIAKLIWLSYSELKSFTVNDNQRFEVMAWPYATLGTLPKYGVYIYTTPEK